MRKNLLVTGASSGIGAAVARLAAARGYDLALHYRNDRLGAEVTARDCEALGARAVLLRADIGRAEDIPGLFHKLDSAFPTLDALVNNAGIVDHAARVEEMTPDRLERMFAVNVIGPMLCAGEAVRRMARRHGGNGGVIVNLSSTAARLGSAGEYVDYAASKAAIDTFTKGLALENAAEGIRAVSLRPGIIETDIHAKGGQPDRISEMAPNLPMGRAGTAEEVAEAVLWLLSDHASYITGTAIDVSGGR